MLLTLQAKDYSCENIPKEGFNQFFQTCYYTREEIEIVKEANQRPINS